MSCKPSTIIGCLSFALATLAAPTLPAQEAAPAAAAADEGKVDEALQAEIRYVETLIDFGFPDFAEPIIAATKKKWPESEVMFFAIEIRGLLSLGKFAEAEAKIAALPDRDGGKYWAARLEVANNYFAQGRKKECAEIYGEFFKKFQTPPKGLREFYLQACYAYGQLLVADRRFDEATQRYEAFLKLLDKKRNDEDANIWCNVACETSEMYLRLASDKATPAERGPYLEKAKRLVDQLLWEQSRPVFFGRAIAMKANIELLKGRLDKAQATIDDYMDQLAELHKNIKDFDPDGRKGLLRQSPMPLCRYMLADMYWSQIESEMKQPKRDDDKIKDLMFGAKLKTGKRNGAGAYNHAVNVYIQYPESAWAGKAEKLMKKIEDLATKTYRAKIVTKITKEQKKKVREMQFRNPGEKLGEGLYEEAIADYLAALASFPEEEESIAAIEKVVEAYRKMILAHPNDPKAKEWRLDCDAVEGYLAERFAGSPNKTLMLMAGDAVMRVAAAEKSMKEEARADALHMAFLRNYTGHVLAATTAAAMAGEAQKEGLACLTNVPPKPDVASQQINRALGLWRMVEEKYASSSYYLTALQSQAVCYEKMGNRAEAIKALSKYIAAEKSPLKLLQSQLQLAMMYQKDALETLAAAGTNDVQVTEGNKQIIRGIKQFADIAAKTEEALRTPKSEADRRRYDGLRESALYLVGDCWSLLSKPEAKKDFFRERAMTNLEVYVSLYPSGKYAKGAYVKLGAMYTAVGNLARQGWAFKNLKEKFPNSEEARNATPRLAKSLIDMGYVKEGTEEYKKMLANAEGASYTAGQYVNAGEALIVAKNWGLANEAFELALKTAKADLSSTNAADVARATSATARANIGMARALYRQKQLDAARDALQTFLEDKKMSRMKLATEAYELMVEVASEQGSRQKDDKLRNKDFAAAIRALKQLRTLWRDRPQEDQDRTILMSADVLIRRMEAEDAMNLEKQAQETCAKAAGTLQAFLLEHHADTKEILAGEKPLVAEQRDAVLSGGMTLPKTATDVATNDQGVVTYSQPAQFMTAAARANLEQCYEKLIPLYVRLGGDNLAYAVKYGTEFLEFFPDNPKRVEVQNAVNESRKRLAAEGRDATPGKDAAPAAAAEEPGDAEAEGAEPAAEEEKTDAEPAAEPAAEAPAAAEPAAEEKESEGDNANE